MHIRASRNLGYIKSSEGGTPWLKMAVISFILLVAFILLYVYVFTGKSAESAEYTASTAIKGERAPRYGANPLLSAGDTTDTSSASAEKTGLALSAELSTSESASVSGDKPVPTKNSLASYEGAVFQAIDQGGKTQEHIKEDARAYIDKMVSRNKEASRGFIRGDQPIRITRSGIDISTVQKLQQQVAAKPAAVEEAPWGGEASNSKVVPVGKDGVAQANGGFAINRSEAGQDAFGIRLTLSSLLAKAPGYAGDTDGLFYVHTVRDKDLQGVWGVIHYSLVDRFAEGIAINEGGKTATYRIKIPIKADEMLPNRRSSFLGRFIDDKVRRSVVYDLEEGAVVVDRNTILPKKQIVVVRFTPEELVLIYQYFANLGNTEEAQS